MFNRIRQMLRNDDDPIVERICSRTKLRRAVILDVISRFETARYVEIAGLLEQQADETLYRDPIEFMPEFRENLALAENDANIELDDRRRGMGFCHLFWRTKKRILREKYGIDWLSPSDMNPMVKFD